MAAVSVCDQRDAATAAAAALLSGRPRHHGRSNSGGLPAVVSRLAVVMALLLLFEPVTSGASSLLAWAPSEPAAPPDGFISERNLRKAALVFSELPVSPALASRGTKRTLRVCMKEAWLAQSLGAHSPEATSR
eukprot:scaffold41637_cov42-Prasinocladus_malaysianus.AAC.1